MLRNPCRKCVVLSMCSEDCDDIRKWRNIKRIFFNTLKTVADCCVISSLFIVALLMIVRCMGEITR